jgi:hypothetical protein
MLENGREKICRLGCNNMLGFVPQPNLRNFLELVKMGKRDRERNRETEESPNDFFGNVKEKAEDAIGGLFGQSKKDRDEREEEFRGSRSKKYKNDDDDNDDDDYDEDEDDEDEDDDDDDD